MISDANSDYGIKHGKLLGTSSIIGSCLGAVSGQYVCGGTGNFIKWTKDLGTADFTLKSTFEAASLSTTALTFVLWVGSTLMQLGLDGHGETFFYKGGAWGQTNLRLGASTLTPNKLQTITLVRISGKLSVSLNGTATPMQNIALPEAVTAVGWRPHQNTIKVTELMSIGLSLL